MTTSRQGSSHTGRKKIQVSFVIRDEVEKRHRSGINSLQFDPAMNRLYSAGRDSIIRIWNTRHQRDYYVSSMEHHVDWVNDIVLACGGRNLISASSDTTVKVWNAQKGYCLSTLRTHKDYVKALAYAKDRELVASAGLDKAIFLWDVTTLTALSASNNTVTTSSLHGCKDSVYSLAMNQPGTVIVAGSTERVIRLWDPRTCEKLVKLKGHSDNVKALLVNREGSQCLSGSSDGTVRLWNIGQQRYVATIRVHTEGVWALQVNDSFSTVYSAGRDKKIYMTDLRNPDQPVLLAEEAAPILKMTLTPDGNHLWVATTESTIRCWPVNSRAPCSTDQELGSPRPQCEEAALVIKGGPSIRQFHILNDKRHILTKDTDNCVALNDVLTARKIEDLGQVDFDEEVRKRFKLIYVPNWFSVDLKTGMLCIHLAQDENDCFSAWVSVSELGMGHEDQADQKVNYGSILLQALLEHWPKVHNSSGEIVENGDEDHCAGDYSRTQNGLMRKAGSEYVSVPDHTPVIFSEIGGRTLYRLLCRDAGNETEGGLLNETVPQWAMDVVILRSLPKFIKVPFYLIPHNSYGAKSLKRDRLIANDFIQIRKVCEHVWEKVLGAGSDSGSTSAQNSSSDKMGDNDLNDLSTLPEAKVEILCQEESLDPSLDLRTVRHFIWKTSSDLVLHYRPIM